MVVKTKSLFHYLDGYRVILVTGCQRTGTNIAARMISHDIHYTYIPEELYETHDRAKFERLVREKRRIVIHCPAMMHCVDNVASEDVAVVVMHRDKQAVYDSMARIKWVARGGLARECEAYGVNTCEDIYSLKYTHFDTKQRDSIAHVYDVQYDDLEQHVLWVDKETRKSFSDWQTKLTTVKVLIATLGYRHLAPAMVSHAKAASYLQSEGVRFDWLTAYGIPDDLKDDPSNGHEIVTRKYQQIRQTFLANDYDVLICIEDDMVIPEDALSRLLTMTHNGADVAYGLYCWRHGMGGGGWSAYTQVTDHWGVSIVADKERAKSLFCNQSIIEVAGVGLGCTAITRSAMDTIPFTRRGHACNDWYFAVDAQSNTLNQQCDMGLVCGHMSLEPTPRIIYPDPMNDDTFQRIEYL